MNRPDLMKWLQSLGTVFRSGTKHLGIGDPSAHWSDDFRTIEFGDSAVGLNNAFISCALVDGDFIIGRNAYWDNTDWRYKQNGTAEAIFMNLFGQAFMFNVAPVGVKDAIITWANVGMVDPSGNWAGIAHLGLSDAPYAYTDEFRTIEFGNSAVGPCTAFQLMDVTNGEYVTGTNAYFDSSDWRYKADGSATALFQNFFGYAYVFNHAPVGVKDAIITWMQAAFVTTTGDWLFPGTSTQYNSYKTPFLLPAIAGVSVITVASTFVGAYTIASAAAGAQTTLTSAGAGVHGLTAAVAVGKSIYISAGTGWPVGLATITALDSDTTGVAITVNIPYDAGMGSPTIPLGGGEVDVALQTVPGNSLGIAGNIVANIMYSEASNGVLNNTLSVYFGGTLMHQFSRNYNIAWMNACAILANAGATNVQIATPINVNYSDSATPSPSSAIDTTADVIYRVTLTTAAIANAWIRIDNMSMTVNPG